MNRIEVVGAEIKIEVGAGVFVEQGRIVVQEDSQLTMLFHDSQVSLEIQVLKGVHLELFVQGEKLANAITYCLAEDSVLRVDKLVVDCSDTIVFKLQGENASLHYRQSIINQCTNQLVMTLEHRADKTESQVVNHGVNVGVLPFLLQINGVIPAGLEDCVCHQDNKIIDLMDSASTICPNLRVDALQVEASHAAYIGRFKVEQLFYLMSRGIPEQSCYLLLLRGFLLGSGNFSEEVEKEFLEKITSC